MLSEIRASVFCSSDGTGLPPPDSQENVKMDRKTSTMKINLLKAMTSVCCNREVFNIPPQ